MAESLPHPPQPPVHTIWWLPYNLYKWLVVVPVLVISTFVLGTLIIILCFLGLANFSSRVFATLWARLNAIVTLMLVRVEGKEKLKLGQSYVLVANHLSLVDIYVLYGFTGIDLKWVMKKELRNVPILGYACQMMGHIYVDRSNTEKALTSIQEARKSIKDGMCVVFFPEGTRSRTQDLLQFKKGAFRMAQDLRIPVIPVSIHNTNRVLPSDTLDWRPGAVKLIFHDPIEIAEDADVNELATQTRGIIVHALNQEKETIRETAA
ncbi:MAG: 1-acyl-sn-glycerol-3-phosphate acyltransferase [Pseudomonadales bacterium]|nr:1-acyl-sn-glycerol-3-phosphate acyltransferase [Pseudomonadales bacterium]